jgi:hypothetical protein
MKNSFNSELRVLRRRLACVNQPTLDSSADVELRGCATALWPPIIADTAIRFCYLQVAQMQLPRKAHRNSRRSQRRLNHTASSLAIELLESRLPLAGDLVISEFMASNTAGLEDEDGDASDWIEIHNRTPEPVSLWQWALTDDADDLASWRFPDVEIPPDGHLVVFASGKDRAEGGRELHTDFRLDAQGEFLALVHPDGVTIEAQLEPAFPPQTNDVSYGLAESETTPTTLLAPNANVVAIVPTEEFDAQFGESWKSVSFEPADWEAGSGGIGYERASGYETLIGLDVGDMMYGNSESIYARWEFDVAEPSRIASLLLHMRYDDGFAAYLNGTLIAERNAPDDLTWNSGATALHSDVEAREFEAIDVSQYVSAMSAGRNVLAIQGLNAGAASNDFLISPQITAVERTDVDARSFKYFETATPGFANFGDAFDELLPQPAFSLPSGVYDSATTVTLRSLTPGATLIYTLDGSAPTMANGRQITPSGEGAFVETTLDIAMTTSVRAATIKDSAISSQPASASYVILSYVFEQPANPAGFGASWAGFSADYGMDRDVIDATLPGYDLRTALTSLPSLVVATPIEDLFGATGIYANSAVRNVERHASIELVYPDGTPGFFSDAGLQMHGNSSRDHNFTPKHPIRVLFKSEHGASKLRHQVFPDSPVTRFDELLLRAASTDSWPVVDGNYVLGVQRWAARHATYMRDQYMRDTQLAMGQPSGHGIYVHLYLDGLYWGVYNLAERPGDSFNAETFGGSKAEYDVIKDFAELESGNMAAWNQLMALANAGLASEAAYQLIQGNNPDGAKHATAEKLLDIENLIDYMILHVYSGAEDWPHHNWWAARRRGPDSEGFRFFVWDQEISNDSLVRTHTLFQTRFEDPVDAPSPAFLYGKLLANPTFRQKFADRVQELCFNGGPLTPEANYARWLARQNELDHAIVAESARWGDSKRTVPYKREVEWLAEMKFMRDVYWPGIESIALERFRRRGLFPAVLAPEVFVDGEARIEGPVRVGAEVELRDENAPAGVVYFTLDGADPWMPNTTIESRTWVTRDTAATYLVPAGPAEESQWFRPEFQDFGWTAGAAAIGYERASGYEEEILTDVSADMFNIRQSVYIRVPFSLDSVPTFDTLTLRMKYDDGFVAYLNGERVAERNQPAELHWNSGAVAQHADAQALQFEELDLSAHRHLLRTGENVLAIHGLNAGAGSNDFLIVPELVAKNTSGDVASGANVYSSPLILDRDSTIRARVKRATEWSSLIEATFTLPSALRISELMFHPPDAPAESPYATEDFEYVELVNTGPGALSLIGYRFMEGIDFQFSDNAAALAPGERLTLVKSLAAFTSRYGQGWNVDGPYEGQLSNSGERLRLIDSQGTTVHDFVFGDDWITAADGEGRSLVLKDLSLSPETWSDPESWAASRLQLGSPGMPEIRLLGDANADGRVDLMDLNLVRNQFGLFGWGDADDDRDIDLEDLNLVRNYFGAHGLPLEATSADAPIDAASSVTTLVAEVDSRRIAALVKHREEIEPPQDALLSDELLSSYALRRRRRGHW